MMLLLRLLLVLRLLLMVVFKHGAGSSVAALSSLLRCESIGRWRDWLIGRCLYWLVWR